MKKMKEETYYPSIRKNILISMILAPLAPFILSLAIGYSYFTRSLESGSVAFMERIVTDHRQMIEAFLKERTDDLIFIQNAYPYGELKQDGTLSKVFAHLREQSGAFVDLGVFDEAGRHTAYHGPFSLKWKNYAEEGWFREVMRQGYYVSDIFLGFRQAPHFIIAVAGEENRRKWVIRATIDTQFFTRMVESIRMGETGEAYLLNADGRLQTHLRSGGGLMEEPPDPVRFPDSREGILTFIDRSAKGNAYLYATTWLKDQKWLLVARQEKADAFSALSSAVRMVTVTALVGIIVILSVAQVMTGRILQRMKQMDAEKQELGQHLIRAQRLAELGEMAAGFAHEINNPLQIIRSEEALVEMNMKDLAEAHSLPASEPLSEIEESLEQIKLQIDRCAVITQSILKFGRQGAPEIRSVDLASFVPQVSGMIEKKAQVHGISVEIEAGEDVLPVSGDPGQLQQVLLNLFNNAIDAVLERHGASGGKIRVRLRSDGWEMTEIAVTDNGCGIHPDNQKKVFSPFFTTKPVGRGTGLGLSVCFGIIQKLGGEMKMDSVPGEGTTFAVRLPSLPRDSESGK